MTRAPSVAFGLALCLFVGAPLSMAQGTAGIFGRTLDASGAAVPGVTVTVTHLGTNAGRESVTDTAGEFAFQQLPVGSYDLSAEIAGFKRYVERRIPLQVDSNRRVEIHLEVGAVAESVTVAAQAAQVELRSGALKEVVDAERIVQLPLNGRNALQLQRLLPGVGGVVDRGQGQNETLSINGTRPNANNYTLDGADNHDPYFNSPSVFPNPDALQEFSLQTSAYSAASGRNAGAVMSAVTKSGTNELHGSLFEFARHHTLNARSFFAKDTPPFERHQFGGTLGGPIARDKTFFFVAYQGWRETSAPGTVTAVVPTPAQRRGDLSSINRAVRDPLTGQPFPGNVIPPGRLHPASQKFLAAMVPLPNGPDGLLSFSSQQRFDQDQVIVKIDHHLSRRNTLTARALWNADRNQEATGNLPGFLADIDYDNLNLALSDTHIVSRRLVNVVRLTFNDIDRVQSSIVPGNQTWTDFGAGFTRSFTGDAPAGWDTQVDGYFNAFSRFPLQHFRQNIQLAEDVHWTRGRHQLSFGGSLGYSKLELRELFRGDPFVRFRNNFTGDALADLLLGRPSMVEQIAETANQPRAWEVGLYAQDDWRVSSRLTLNLGVRWEPYFPFTERGDRFGQFRPGQQSVVFPGAPVGAVFPGDPGVPRALFEGRSVLFAPRLGFAWDPFGKGTTSVRGGYGVFHSQIRQQAHNQVSTNQPFSIKLTLDDLPLGLDNPYSRSGNPFPFTAPAAGAAARYTFVKPLVIDMFDPGFRNAVVQQWNLNVQRQFLRSHVATLAYVGSKGEHLFISRELNPARPGSGPTNSRRIQTDFASIVNKVADGESTYHALQVSWNKRLSGSFTLLASYTWSKFVDDGSSDGSQAPNPFDLEAQRGRSDLDIPHRFVGSFLWATPGLASARPLVRQLLGGWQINGIVVFQSGRPFSAVSGRDNSQSGVNLDRADIAGDPSLPGDRSRDDVIQRYFNTAAFAQNAVGTFGTSGRNILRGPGFSNVDLGVVKDVTVAARHKIQLRVEIFNVFNRVNLGQPNGNLSSASFGRITGTVGDPRVIQLGLKYLF